MVQHLYGAQLHDDVVTSAKQGPGQWLDEVSHEDLKLVDVDEETKNKDKD